MGRVQPRIHQRRPIRAADGRGRGGPGLERAGAGRAARGALPGRRHRGEPLPAAADRCDREGQPAHRPRRHGVGGPPLHARDPLRQPGGAGSGGAPHGLREGEGARSVRAAGRGAGAVPELEPLDLPPRPPAAQLHGDDHRPDRHHLDDRGVLLGDRAGLRAGFRAPGQGVRRGARAHLCERGLRATGEGAGLPLRGAHGRGRAARVGAARRRRGRFRQGRLPHGS